MPAGILTGDEARPGRMIPELPSVTLVAVTSISVNATVKALEQSLGQANFGAALLLSDQAPASTSRFEWRRIDPIRSRADYSRFMLQQLGQQIDTEFALCVQWDGYVLDGSCWRPEFLDYDYIGAPWPHFEDDRRVGNGGFSLRSKRLLEASSKLPYSPNEAEDIAICRTHRAWLEEHETIRFAPESIARAFAFERLPSHGTEFGFHGVFNMRRTMGRSNFAKLMAMLDPGTVGRLEARELLWQAMTGADPLLAWRIVRDRIAASRP